MITILLATGNQHKAQEVAQILGDTVTVVTLRAFPGAPAVVEDAPTFAGNARKKVVSLAEWLCREQPAALKAVLGASQTLWALADDSGLEVDFLEGAPGVHSARFAAADHVSGNAPDAANNAKLLRLLAGVPLEKRTARFRCVLAAVPLPRAAGDQLEQFSEEKILQCDGVCEGRIALTPGGQGGFGYDPLFMPEGHEVSFGELGEDVKNSMSHRARALAQFAPMCLSQSA